LLSFFIKAIMGCLGFVFFVVIAKRIVSIHIGCEQIQETLKDQNIKIVKKSIELSDVMRQFEDQNYDLQNSRKETREILTVVREKERDQRIIFDNSPLGIIRFNTEGEILECNKQFVDLMGSKKEDLIGFNIARNSSPEMRETLIKALHGKVAVFEGEYTSITGSKTIDLRAVFNPVTPSVFPTQVVATIEEVTERKQAEKQLKQSHDDLERAIKKKTLELIKEIEERKMAHNALKKSEEKYRSILKNIDDSYFELDRKGKLIFFNNSLTELLGYSTSELNGLEYEKYVAREDIGKLKRVFKRVVKTGQASQLVNCTLITKNNNRKNVGIISSLMRNKKGDSIGFQGLARDDTKLKIIESQIQQTRKMEAIGNLAGGVAHDFNNILGGIIGYTQLIKNNSANIPKIQPYVDQVIKASERAKGLVNQILLFSRKTETKKIPLDIGLIAEEVLKLVRASIPSTIEITHHFKKDLNPILADQTQIHQVIMNLCSNASDAMKNGGGHLEITLKSITILKDTLTDSATDFEKLTTGDYIQLSVSDTGKGIDKKTLAKIFDPYFTTKEAGSGTGLGLATIHGIVKDHGGVIHVKSEVSQGTVFRLFFPIVNQTIEKEIHVVKIEKGSETILFVDDEEYLAEVGKEMLEDYGYEVESITSSQKALNLFQDNPDRFDLLITDYTMPDLTGEILARKIQEERPDLPMIMCTGVSLDPDILDGINFKKILMKPVDMNDMLMIVRDVLNRSSKTN